MNCFWGQIVLAARDTEEWMNILFFVAIAAFYAIGSVLKAKASKSAKQKKAAERQGVRPTEKGPVRPAAKKSPPPATVTKPAYPQPPRRLVARPRPVMRMPILKREPLGPKAVKQPRMAEPLPSVPPLESKLKGLPKPPKKTIRELDIGQLGLAAEKKQKEPVILEEPLLPLDDPDALRRAILHYEILGKPISLRRPGEHLVGM
ncbi:MAG: hypothetical protein JSV99_05660 [Planctomycetota bacterium]|nr:MAG: hypothetical protein JSV99_05660 [Planctomycetota bacterium]